MRWVMMRSDYLMLKTWLVIGQVIKECELAVLESFFGLIKTRKLFTWTMLVLGVMYTKAEPNPALQADRATARRLSLNVSCQKCKVRAHQANG